MRVFIDTNALVSAVLKGREPSAIIQFIVNSQNHEWIVSEEILSEYKEVLNRSKFKLTDEVKEEWSATLEALPRLVNVNVDINFPRDRKDANLACAVAAEADFLITGDRDFIEAQMPNTAIISVSLFKMLVCDVVE